mmetsp:Transcript_25263/g.83484  ORF Transcript_25263/g.83484 Transcript_25263/m.83484 type:complete len:227 (-) Transcript_25263:1362-2042(-)
MVPWFISYRRSSINGGRKPMSPSRSPKNFSIAVGTSLRGGSSFLVNGQRSNSLDELGDRRQEGKEIFLRLLYDGFERPGLLLLLAVLILLVISASCCQRQVPLTVQHGHDDARGLQSLCDDVGHIARKNLLLVVERNAHVSQLGCGTCDLLDGPQVFAHGKLKVRDGRANGLHPVFRLILRTLAANLEEDVMLARVQLAGGATDFDDAVSPVLAVFRSLAPARLWY